MAAHVRADAASGQLGLFSPSKLIFVFVAQRLPSRMDLLSSDCITSLLPLPLTQEASASLGLKIDRSPGAASA